MRTQVLSFCLAILLIVCLL
uniref:Uncharacterized protein n=1 Tax=Drosophila melanogaster TaxID=7227 RepID=A0A1Z1CH02_DROME|nr:uncharacterized protein Dmel_CG46313 [Drosophila melanogaster]API64948.1 uncharacterized protein Dmel_CG14253 [Drosophila melanogaster]|eukprot:NP_001334703.1 uncharacterized protein Dmel_CG46313 [Drosophila melanogaster]